MEETEVRLRECRLARVPDEVQERILSGRRQKRRPNWPRRFWMGIAASVLVIWVVNVCAERTYDLSPYEPSVAVREPVEPEVLREYEAEVAALLGDAARGYLAYLRGERNGG